MHPMASAAPPQAEPLHQDELSMETLPEMHLQLLLPPPSAAHLSAPCVVEDQLREMVSLLANQLLEHQ